MRSRVTGLVLVLTLLKPFYIQIRTELKIENENREIDAINRTVRDHQNDMLKLNQVRHDNKITKIEPSEIIKMTC